jgi:hypothetical protein
VQAPDAGQAVKEAIAQYGDQQSAGAGPSSPDRLAPGRTTGTAAVRRTSGRNRPLEALTPCVWLTTAILDGVALRAIVERPKSRIGRGVSALVSAAAEIELHHRPAIARPIARSVIHRHTAAPVIKHAPATAVRGIGGRRDNAQCGDPDKQTRDANRVPPLE